MNRTLLIICFLSFICTSCIKDIENKDIAPFLDEDEVVGVLENETMSDSIVNLMTVQPDEVPQLLTVKNVSKEVIENNQIKKVKIVKPGSQINSKTTDNIFSDSQNNKKTEEINNLKEDQYSEVSSGVNLNGGEINSQIVDASGRVVLDTDENNSVLSTKSSGNKSNSAQRKNSDEINNPAEEQYERLTSNTNINKGDDNKSKNEAERVVIKGVENNNTDQIVKNNSITAKPTNTKIESNSQKNQRRNDLNETDLVNYADSEVNTNSGKLEGASVTRGNENIIINKDETNNRFVFNNGYKDTNQSAFNIRLLKKEKVYQTNTNYTLLVEVLNKRETINQLNLDVDMPVDWQIISISKIGTLNKGQKKLCFISFFIPSNSSAGSIDSKIFVNQNNAILQTLDFKLKVANNYDLELFDINVPQQLQAGDLIETKVAIKNNGNVDQELQLKSRNTIDGESVIIIPKDSTVVVQLSQKTNAKSNAFRRVGTNLEVFSKSSGKTYYNSQNTEVIPTQIQQKDPFFRYPMQASLYYSSHTKKQDHYSTMSAELKGNGYLDINKDHYLNFTIRAPKKENLKRFSIVDQYSLIYKHKDKMTLYLGDHSYFLNRLGFGPRYGMGFKLDYNVKKWTFSTFFSKPRLYNYNRKPLYGAQVRYYESDSLSLGLTLEKSEGNSYNYNYFFNQDGKGQIVTLDYDYKNKNTFIDAEVSSSFNGESTDYGTNINLIQNYRNLTYASNLLVTGDNYFGNISNSLQLANSLNYNNKGFNLGLGHAFSRVNKRLDPELFETEPYYENYFATLGYRFTNKHYLNFRFDKRVREDQLLPRDYYYKEYGFNLNFNYTDRLFTGSFGTRFAKTQNILSDLQNYRNTYANHLQVSYKIFRNFNLRGGFNHIYTNRYGYKDTSSNYFRYNLGFNYTLNRCFYLNANYNSGFSLEESYRRRDYINVNLRAQINRHHRVEVRANYFENPNVLDNKELFVYGKYTYSFGLGLKRILEQGGVTGSVIAKSDSITVKGIKIYTAGKTIITDSNGDFELNNLEIGSNYVFVEDTSLPLNVLMAVKNPIEVIVEENKQAVISIPLLQAGNLYGNLNLENKNKVIEPNMEAYVKIESDDFTYYTETTIDGAFQFVNIVPGNYSFEVIRFKNNKSQFVILNDEEVIVKDGSETRLNIPVKGKERKIKFKNSNFNVAIKQ